MVNWNLFKIGYQLCGIFVDIAVIIIYLTSELLDHRCSHSDRAGQELCYLCHQRSQKNVPIYFAEERRQRELEEDRLLQQYQQQKDTEAILKEQVRRTTLSRICLWLYLFVADLLKVVSVCKLITECFKFAEFTKSCSLEICSCKATSRKNLHISPL